MSAHALNAHHAMIPPPRDDADEAALVLRVHRQRTTISLERKFAYNAAGRLVRTQTVARPFNCG